MVGWNEMVVWDGIGCLDVGNGMLGWDGWIGGLVLLDAMVFGWYMMVGWDKMGLNLWVCGMAWLDGIG